LYLERSQNKGRAPADVIQVSADIETRLAPAADLVITVSDGIADELQRLYNIDRPLVIRNCQPLTPSGRTNRLREAIGGDNGRAVLLYQGGFMAGRGLLELVAAADLVPEADFVLLGYESAYKERVADAASQSKHGNVHMLPCVPVDDLWQFTCSADAGFILTQPVCLSYELTLSNKIFEYMMAGIPAIASGMIAGHRALAEETGVVVLVDPFDPCDIARGAKELLADAEEMKRMGAAARGWAERKYNASHETEKLRAAYEQLTQDDRRSR